ncbi:unnamed protein product [Arctogadus glacialis]
MPLFSFFFVTFALLCGQAQSTMLIIMLCPGFRPMANPPALAPKRNGEQQGEMGKAHQKGHKERWRCDDI